MHPFLFSLRHSQNESKIHIDWEHSEYKFIPPSQLKHFETVPQLKETFDRVHLVPSLEDPLEKIKTNTSKGAAGLALDALQCLETFCFESETKQSDRLSLEQLAKNLSWHLMHVRPSMAPVGNVVGSVVAKSLREGGDLLEALKKNITKAKEHQQEVSSALQKHLDDCLRDNDTIMTLSYSGSVCDVLKQSRRKNLHMIVAESRPLLEGRTTAFLLRKEAQESVKDITLCTDAAMATVAEEEKIQGALVGADSILPDGSFVNKTGTHLLSMICQARGVPLWVVSDSSKIRAEREVTMEIGPSGDLLDHPPPMGPIGNSLEEVGVVNPIFEIIPSASHIRFVTEEGVLSPSDLKPFVTQAEEDLQEILN